MCCVCPASCNGSARIALFSMANARERANVAPAKEMRVHGLAHRDDMEGQALPLGDMQYCSLNVIVTGLVEAVGERMAYI